MWPPPDGDRNERGLEMKKAIAGMLAIGLLFGLGVAAQADISSNLIGHWKFDEAASGTGTGTALDSSGGGYKTAPSAAARSTPRARSEPEH